MTLRIDAALVLVVHADRALVLRRRPNDRSFAHQWCLPGGRIEAGESPGQTALREIAEETGLAIRIERELGARPVGAFRIHRFVARADAPAVTLSDEHVAARWLTRAEAMRAEVILPSGLAGEVTRELLARFAQRAELR